IETTVAPRGKGPRGRYHRQSSPDGTSPAVSVKTSPSALVMVRESPETSAVTSPRRTLSIAVSISPSSPEHPFFVAGSGSNVTTPSPTSADPPKPLQPVLPVTSPASLICSQADGPSSADCSDTSAVATSLRIHFVLTIDAGSAVVSDSDVPEPSSGTAVVPSSLQIGKHTSELQSRENL